MFDVFVKLAIQSAVDDSPAHLATFLRSCPNLKTLTLTHQSETVLYNVFCGANPGSLACTLSASLTSLVKLDLRNCHGTNALGALRFLTNLESLDITGLHDFDAATLTHLHRLHRLKSFTCADCLAWGDTSHAHALLLALRDLPHLVSLHLGEGTRLVAGQATVDATPLSAHTRLTSLTFAAYEYRVPPGDYLPAVLSMTNLVRLNLMGCMVDDDCATLWPQLQCLTKLEFLALAPSAPLDEHVTWLLRLVILTTLMLHRAEVSGAGLRRLHALPRLQSLVLQEMDRLDDGVWPAVTGFPCLTMLGLSEAPLKSNQTVTNLAVMSTLQTLVLDVYCDGPLAAFRMVRGMCLATQLKHLKLARCDQIVNPVVQQLSVLTNLQTLALRFAYEVTDAGFSFLSSLTELEQLDLKMCRGFADRGLAAVQHLVKLRHLNLYGCNMVVATCKRALRGLPKLGLLHYGVEVNYVGIVECCSVPAQMNMWRQFCYRCEGGGEGIECQKYLESDLEAVHAFLTKDYQ